MQTYIDPGDKEPMTTPFLPDQKLIWEDGKEIAELRPGEKSSVLLAYLDEIDSPHLRFGMEGFANHLFRRESVYQVGVQFMGKYKEENEFRRYDYMQVYYANPDENTLLDREEAIKVEGIIEPFMRVIESARKGFWRDYSSPFRRQQERKQKEVRNSSKAGKKINPKKRKKK